MGNDKLLSLINILLLANFILGFFWNRDGILFNEMYRTNPLIVSEKNILNLGTYIISLQSYSWLKNHKHMAEFYMLLLSTLARHVLHDFFQQHLLMFIRVLELSSIPLAAMCKLRSRKKNFLIGRFLSLSCPSAFFIRAACSFAFRCSMEQPAHLTFLKSLSYIDGENPLQIFSFHPAHCGIRVLRFLLVPFHLWTADVYEGSPVAVTSYLSVDFKKAPFLFVLYP